jgi:hypothetical protein
LGDKPKASDEEVKESVPDPLNGLAADFYDEGIVKFVLRVDKRLNRNGNYAEK